MTGRTALSVFITLTLNGRELETLAVVPLFNTRYQVRLTCAIVPFKVVVASTDNGSDRQRTKIVNVQPWMDEINATFVSGKQIL